jgi:hypothetical protein
MPTQLTMAHRQQNVDARADRVRDISFRVRDGTVASDGRRKY